MKYSNALYTDDAVWRINLAVFGYGIATNKSSFSLDVQCVFIDNDAVPIEFKIIIKGGERRGAGGGGGAP